MKIRYLFTLIGYLFFVSAIISFLVLSFIITGTNGENFSRDLFGFQIPQAPEWTSFIPYLGLLITFIFESFSVHGLVQFSIMIGMIMLGSIFLSIGKIGDLNTTNKNQTSGVTLLQKILLKFFSSDIRKLTTVNEVDPLFRSVVEYVIKTSDVTPTELQKEFSIGYGRAMKLINTLEANGIFTTTRKVNVDKAKEYLISGKQ